ncbi:hypothetical protein OUZ56_015922 [Daphnia magna]|uniref:Uncharacterized protein n=1 Tax=Daphnia magna TaxID=35525 RepID=A0ABR0AP52_9CRUS|nr:hypothetical protein OUZ56_015922 [Daphnia magna]
MTNQNTAIVKHLDGGTFCVYAHLLPKGEQKKEELKKIKEIYNEEEHGAFQWNKEEEEEEEEAASYLNTTRCGSDETAPHTHNTQQKRPWHFNISHFELCRSEGGRDWTVIKFRLVPLGRLLFSFPRPFTSIETSGFTLHNTRCTRVPNAVPREGRLLHRLITAKTHLVSDRFLFNMRLCGVGACDRRVRSRPL